MITNNQNSESHPFIELSLSPIAVTISFGIIRLTIFLILFGFLPLSLFSQEITTISPIPNPAGKEIKKDAKPQKLTFRYEKTQFKTGVDEVVIPIVNKPGGKFSYERISQDTFGGLLFNTTTGIFYLKHSDPGVYMVIYTIKDERVSITITLE
jgi:hypothetical protein